MDLTFSANRAYNRFVFLVRGPVKCMPMKELQKTFPEGYPTSAGELPEGEQSGFRPGIPRRHDGRAGLEDPALPHEDGRREDDVSGARLPQRACEQ